MKFKGEFMPRGVLLSFLLLTACSSSPKKGASLDTKSVPVAAVVSEVADVPICVESIGKLMPSAVVELFPSVSGTLCEVLVKEGQWVEKDTPLFSLDETLYLIKVEEARAHLMSDQAALQSLKGRLSRFEKLSNHELISKSDWDDLVMQRERAELLIVLDEARLKIAQLDLESCQIKAPASGRIGKIDVTPGVYLKSSAVKPLVTLTDIHSLLVEFAVTEKEFARLASEPKEIEIDTLVEGVSCHAKGQITFVDDHFDPKTGQLLVRAIVENRDEILKPGQSISVKLPIEVAYDAKLIPQKAVRYNEMGSFVYSVGADQTVQFNQVQLGDSQDDRVIVLDGLDPETLIITEGHLRLYPGIKVDIRS